MIKKVSTSQKEEISSLFVNGVKITEISQKFGFSSSTITRQLQKYFGKERFLEIKNFKKNSQNNSNIHKPRAEITLDNNNPISIEETSLENNLSEVSSFFEIPPLAQDIEFDLQKEISSIPISEVSLPQMVYMIVSKNIELESRNLYEFPEWSFLPQEDLNRKVIKIYAELKNAKRECKKDQKVIKVPNSNVFGIASSFLLAKGISRIISETQLISL